MIHHEISGVFLNVLKNMNIVDIKLTAVHFNNAMFLWFLLGLLYEEHLPSIHPSIQELSVPRCWGRLEFPQDSHTHSHTHYGQFIDHADAEHDFGLETKLVNPVETQKQGEHVKHHAQWVEAGNEPPTLKT